MINIAALNFLCLICKGKINDYPYRGSTYLNFYGCLIHPYCPEYMIENNKLSSFQIYSYGIHIQIRFNEERTYINDDKERGISINRADIFDINNLDIKYYLDKANAILNLQ